MKQGNWLKIIGVLVACLLVVYFTRDDLEQERKRQESIEVSNSLLDGVVFSAGEQHLPVKNISHVTVQNQFGNTFIKHSNQEEMSIEAVVRTSDDSFEPEYEVTRKGKELVIEVLNNEKSSPLDLTINLPEGIKEIDSRSTYGNIRGDIIETDFIRFVTYFGHLTSEFEKVNQQGEYIFMTNVGQIYTVVPEGTELSFKNLSPYAEVNLKGVKESHSAAKFTLAALDIGWMPPQIIGKASLEKFLENQSLDKPASITNQQLIEDLEKTIQLMKENHPFVKTNPSFYEPIFKHAREKAQSINTREELYFILSELMVATKDGHTMVYYGKDRIDLPVIKWTAMDELVVEEDSGPFEKGDRILSIGGKEDSVIIEAARTYISADHEEGVKGKFNSFLENLLHLRYLGMVRDTEELKISLERVGKEQTVSLLIPKPSTLSPIISLFEESVKNPYSWSIDPTGKFGIFKMDQCIPTELYYQMLEAFFTEVKEKNIPNIVVDIRGNSGGNSGIITSFISYLDVDDEANLFRDPSVSKELIFSGNVYVLTANETFSAGTDFATAIQGYGIGKLIGETPGNNASFGGNPLRYILNNSGIDVQIPTTKNLAPAPLPADQQDKPLTVDYPIEVTRESILNGQDLWMEKVEELTKN